MEGTLIFLSFIVRYVESQFTLLTYWRHTTVIPYILETYHCNTLLRKETDQQQDKTKSLAGLLCTTKHYIILQESSMNVWITVAETFLGIQKGFRTDERCSKYTTLRPNWERPAKMQNFALLKRNEADSASWSFKSWNNFCAGRCRNATRAWLVSVKSNVYRPSGADLLKWSF